MNQTILEKLGTLCTGSIVSAGEFRDELTIVVKKEDIARVCLVLRDDPELQFDMVIDVFGVDMIRPEDRFEVVYILFSRRLNAHLRLKVLVDEQDCTVPTVTGVWEGANWHERETFDMLGVRFAGHPDLRRLYMPEEFEYHPLRKDFPTLGIPDSLPLPRK